MYSKSLPAQSFDVLLATLLQQRDGTVCGLPYAALQVEPHPVPHDHHRVAAELDYLAAVSFDNHLDEGRHVRVHGMEQRECTSLLQQFRHFGVTADVHKHHCALNGDGDEHGLILKVELERVHG